MEHVRFFLSAFFGESRFISQRDTVLWPKTWPKRTLFIILLFFGSIFPLAFQSKAQDITLIPTFSVGATHNTNVLQQSEDELETTNATISPGLTVLYTTPKLNVRSGAQIDMLRYKDEKELDTENQLYWLDAGFDMTKSFNVLGNFSYFRDSQIERTHLTPHQTSAGLDIVTQRERRKGYNALFGGNFRLTPASLLGITYSHTKVDYDRDGSDYDFNAGSLFYSREFNKGIDIFTIQTSYYKRDSDVIETDTSGLSLGWEHKVNEITTFKASLGAQYAEESTKPDGISNGNWGALVDIEVLRLGKCFDSTLGYRHDFAFDINGVLLQYDEIYLLSATPGRIGRFGGRLFINYRYPDLFGKYDVGDVETRSTSQSSFFGIEPSISYFFTEDNSLEIGGDYNNYFDANNSRTRCWVKLHFRFPQRW